MNPIEKNLLDLQHSLSQTKAALFFSVGIGSSIAIFFGLRQLEVSVMVSFITAELVSFIFILKSIQNFVRCTIIQRQIEDYINSKTSKKKKQF